MFLSGKVSDVTSGQQLITETFTSSTTWTAPAGVTLLTTVSGKGSDGVSDAWLSNQYGGAIEVDTAGNFFSDYQNTTGLPNAPYLQWSTVQAAISSKLSDMNSSSGERYVYYPQITWEVGYDGTWAQTVNLFNWLGPILVRGVITNDGVFSSKSGNVMPADVGNWYTASYFNIAERFQSGGTGNSASAFGLTFAGGSYSGGTGYPASTTYYSNVSVTPGTGYTINVPSGGFVSFSYTK